MYKFTEAELFSLLAINLMQFEEGTRTKEALLETCRMLKDEVGVEGLIGFCVIIKATLEGTYQQYLEDMLFSHDDVTNPTYQLLEALYRANLSQADTLKAVTDALFIEVLKMFEDNRDAMHDMLYILTNKIEMIGEQS